MRTLTLALAAMSLSASAVPSDPGEETARAAAWESCGTLRGASVCTWTALVRRGGQVCAVRQDFATNTYYVHRLMGVAAGDGARFTRICGDPGSETDSFCEGQAPDGAEKVGWTSYDQTVRICDGRLSFGAAECSATSEDDMRPVAFSELPMSDDDRAWLTTCAPQ